MAKKQNKTKKHYNFCETYRIGARKKMENLLCVCVCLCVWKKTLIYFYCRLMDLYPFFFLFFSQSVIVLVVVVITIIIIIVVVVGGGGAGGWCITLLLLLLSKCFKQQQQNNKTKHRSEPNTHFFDKNKTTTTTHLTECYVIITWCSTCSFVNSLIIQQQEIAKKDVNIIETQTIIINRKTIFNPKTKKKNFKCIIHSIWYKWSENENVLKIVRILFFCFCVCVCVWINHFFHSLFCFNDNI